MTRRTRATARAKQQIHEDGTQSEDESASSAEGQEQAQECTNSPAAPSSTTKRRPLCEIVLNVEPAAITPTTDDIDSSLKKPNDTGRRRTKKSKKNPGKDASKNKPSAPAAVKGTSFQLLTQDKTDHHTPSCPKATAATPHPEDSDTPVASDDALGNPAPMVAAAVENQGASPNLASMAKPQQDLDSTQLLAIAESEDDVGSKMKLCGAAPVTSIEPHETPQAVQKLESLFNLEDGPQYDDDSARSVMEVMSRSVTGTTLREVCSDPIVALDELEDAIENVECNFRAQKSSQRYSIIRTDTRYSNMAKSSTSTVNSVVVQDSKKLDQNISQEGRATQSVTSDNQRRYIDCKLKSTSTNKKTKLSQSGQFMAKKHSDTPTSNSRQQPEATQMGNRVRQQEKAREQEEEERKAFKARPIPRAVGVGSVQVRPTAASMARMNSIQKQKASRSITKAPREGGTASSGSTTQTSTVGTGKYSTARTSTKSIACSSQVSKSCGSLMIDRKSSVAVSSVRSPITARHRALPTKGNPLSKDAGDVNKRQTANRTGFELPEQSKLAKERAEIARNARAEAAERSRQQSRLWAAKKAATLKNQQAVANDEGDGSTHTEVFNKISTAKVSASA